MHLQLASRHVSIANHAAVVLLTLAVFGASICQNLPAEERQPNFAVPTQGHIELTIGFGIEVRGLQVKTQEDVVALYDRIEAIPYDEEAILNYRLIEQLGWERIQPQFHPPPPNANQLGLPEIWRPTVIDFTQERFVQRSRLGEFESLVARSRRSEVSYTKHPTHTQVTHADADHSRRLWYDVAELMSRREPLSPNGYTIEEIPNDDRIFCVTTNGKATWKLLTEPDKDVIHAWILMGSERIVQFGLHNHCVAPDTPDGMWIPQLTLRVRSLPSHGQIRTYFNLIHKADFQQPPAADALRMPIQKGMTYVYANGRQGFVRRISVDIEDLLKFAPHEVIALNNWVTLNKF